MKYHAASMFIVVLFFMHGCDDSAVNSSVEELQKVLPAKKVDSKENQKQVETKKQSVKPKLVKSVKNKKPAEIKPKEDEKPTQSIIEGDSVTAEPIVLDLSVPLKIVETENSDSVLSNNQNYLPDLFADQQDQKSKAMEVDGKIIKREEEAVGKVRVDDGVGVDFKLAH
jgi:hypothetical protein